VISAYEQCLFPIDCINKNDFAKRIEMSCREDRTNVTLPAALKYPIPEGRAFGIVVVSSKEIVQENSLTLPFCNPSLHWRVTQKNTQP
jgi:hypothetical protein